MWEDEPGTPIPNPKNDDSWWYQISEWFKNLINNIKSFFSKIGVFFSSAESIIIVSVIVIILIILILSLFKFINFVNNARVAKELRRYNRRK